VAAEAALVELELATRAALDGRWARAARLTQRAHAYLEQLAAEERRTGRAGG
jgi:hypothetical protein